MKILVRSSEEASQSLVKFFATTNVTKDIYTPGLEDEVRIGEHVSSYSIMLGDSITNRLSSRLSKVSLRVSAWLIASV